MLSAYQRLIKSGLSVRQAGSYFDIQLVNKFGSFMKKLKVHEDTCMNRLVPNGTLGSVRGSDNAYSIQMPRLQKKHGIRTSDSEVDPLLLPFRFY